LKALQLRVNKPEKAVDCDQAAQEADQQAAFFENEIKLTCETLQAL